jgi:hypothetical protein
MDEEKFPPIVPDESSEEEPQPVGEESDKSEESDRSENSDENEGDDDADLGYGSEDDLFIERTCEDFDLNDYDEYDHVRSKIYNLRATCELCGAVRGAWDTLRSCPCTGSRRVRFRPNELRPILFDGLLGAAKIGETEFDTFDMVLASDGSSPGYYEDWVADYFGTLAKIEALPEASLRLIFCGGRQPAVDFSYALYCNRQLVAPKGASPQVEAAIRSLRPISYQLLLKTRDAGGCAFWDEERDVVCGSPSVCDCAYAEGAAAVAHDIHMCAADRELFVAAMRALASATTPPLAALCAEYLYCGISPAPCTGSRRVCIQPSELRRPVLFDGLLGAVKVGETKFDTFDMAIAPHEPHYKQNEYKIAGYLDALAKMENLPEASLRLIFRGGMRPAEAFSDALYHNRHLVAPKTASPQVKAAIRSLRPISYQLLMKTRDTGNCAFWDEEHDVVCGSPSDCRCAYAEGAAAIVHDIHMCAADRELFVAAMRTLATSTTPPLAALCAEYLYCGIAPALLAALERPLERLEVLIHLMDENEFASLVRQVGS